MRKFSKLAALVMVLVLSLAMFAGCGKSATAIETYFFIYDVLNAEKVDSYEGVTPAAGNKLLVVNISVQNTFGEDIPMFDSDFQLQWGEGDEDYANPLEATSDKQLPEEYTLKNKETRKGALLFEIPADLTDFTLVNVEFFEDETVGDFHELPFQVK